MEFLNKVFNSLVTNIIILALGIIALIIQTCILLYSSDTSTNIISFICLFVFLLIDIFGLINITKLNLTTKKLKSEEQYNKTLHDLNDKVRGFKHDFNNIITTIGGYVKTNDMEGLKSYYFELEGDCQKVNNLSLLNPKIINNPGIYNLIITKYNQAEKKNIKVNMTFLLDLNCLKMKIYEFTRILGILIDNAIDASSECDEKIINITFMNDNKKNRQLIIIENTYNNKDIDTEKIFGKGITRKRKSYWIRFMGSS